MQVLIFSAAAGGGHNRTAQALEGYIRNSVPGAQVKVADALKEVHSLYDRVICSGYRFVATKTPVVFGRMYKDTNRSNSVAGLVPKMNHMLGRHLLGVIEQFQPDILVATHPFAAEMLSALKYRGEVTAKLLVILTDYAPHRTWIVDQADGYIVANDDMVHCMVHTFGVEPQKIYPFGIPVPQAFFHRGSKPELRKAMGFAPDKPTILLMAGSFGVRMIAQIYREIMYLPQDFQMIVITGNNRRLYQSLKTTAMLSPKKTKLILFTEKVEQYMHASDLLITKPGGLTVSEALACNLPMLLFDAIPGQEQANADFLERHGMALKLGKKQNCAQVLGQLLENRAELSAMELACKQFDRENGCAQIVALMQNLIEENLC